MTQLLPEVLSVRHESDVQVVFDLHVPLELAHFKGHFPDRPILPGVVQLDWAIRLAREHLSQLALYGMFMALENIKFQALVRPDARLALTLRWDAALERLEFVYATRERKYSSGRVLFRCEA